MIGYRKLFQFSGMLHDHMTSFLPYTIPAILFEQLEKVVVLHETKVINLLPIVFIYLEGFSYKFR